MKYTWFFLVAFLLSGCQKHNLEITGTAKNMDGATVSILDLKDKTLDSTIIKAGKFDLQPEKAEKAGYYTFSIMSGKYPNDFEIYLEPGKYDIGIPEKTGDYLVIKTSSKIQNDLSAYYTFEDSVMYTFRHQVEILNTKLNDPKVKSLSEADYNKLLSDLKSATLREKGAATAVMDVFVDKYPKNDIVIHVITNMDYQANPLPYYLVYQKLSPAAKNSVEGKQVGQKLEDLVKQAK